MPCQVTLDYTLVAPGLSDIALQTAVRIDVAMAVGALVGEGVFN